MKFGKFYYIGVRRRPTVAKISFTESFDLIQNSLSNVFHLYINSLGATGRSVQLAVIC